MAFVHLHNHTVFSMLDGATHIQDIVNRAVGAGHTRRGHHRPRLHVRRARPGAGLRRRQPQHARVQNLEPRQGLLGKGPPRRAGEADPEENPREHAQYVKDMAMWDEKGDISDNSSRTWSSNPSLAARSTPDDARPRPQARALPHDPSGQGPGGLRQPDADGL